MLYGIGKLIMKKMPIIIKPETYILSYFMYYPAEKKQYNINDIMTSICFFLKRVGVLATTSA